MLLNNLKKEVFISLLQLKNVRAFTGDRVSKKKKIHWHKLATKKFPKDKALEHFDDFYKSIFRLKWPSVRLGLLSPRKYLALVNNFGDVEETEKLLSNLGAMDLKELFDVYKRNEADKKDAQMREDNLESVAKLDKLMDEKFKQQEESDLTFLYPDGSGDKLKGLLFNERDKDSYKVGETSENDNSNRLIDPDLGIDSGSLHEFIPATKLKGMEEFMPESEYYSFYKSTSDVPINIEKQYDLKFPERLKAYTFDRGVVADYPPPRMTSLNVLNYYLMDGASLLPVLALGLRPGERVLDMCAAPGGKSLAILQTMAPDLLVCNDLSNSRVNRIHNVLGQYLYDYTTNWKNMVMVQQMDGAYLEESNLYDKILVDVPCTNDKKSVQVDDNNIFHQLRVKERLQIPETQARLLSNALSIVRPGGTVVYSTCSLSPVQNEGVVGMALRKLWEEHRLEFTVIDMEPALRCTRHFFNYGTNIGLKYGHLVVPFLPSNFGPMYFCKIVRK